MKYIVKWQADGDCEQAIDFQTIEQAREATQALRAKGEANGTSWAIVPRYEVVYDHDDLVRSRRMLGEALINIGQDVILGNVPPSDTMADLASVTRKLDDVLAQIDALERETHPGSLAQNI